MARKPTRRRGAEVGADYESLRPARHGPATEAAPGSPAKIAVMMERMRQRQSLHAPGDACESPAVLTRNARFLLLVVGSDPADSMRLAEQARRQVLRQDACGRGGIEAQKKIAAARNEIGTKTNGDTPGDRIRRAREAAGLSLRGLAAQAGLSAPALLAVERRRSAPCLWVLCRVAAVLGIALDWLACLAVEAGAVRCLCA